MKKILLIEDETHVVSFIKKGLSEEGYEVSVALDGNTGLKMATNSVFDLLILDIMLPDINGLDICKNIRTSNKIVPILLLTALGTSENVVMGFEAGADDYLVKPFKFMELLARTKSLIRRSNLNTEKIKGESKGEVFKFSEIIIDDYSKKVTCANKEISLTSTEYKLLLQFVKKPGKVISRMELLESVWGVDFDQGTNVVDVYVNYIRKKLSTVTDQKLIHTVIGMGYVMRNS